MKFFKSTFTQSFENVDIALVLKILRIYIDSFRMIVTQEKSLCILVHEVLCRLSTEKGK